MKLLVTPKKSLGQNFLANPRILDKIVAAAEITKDDIILEVGPGTGNLTEKLATNAKKVIAIEKDQRLIEQLKEKFKNKNVEIMESDVLKLKIVPILSPSEKQNRGSSISKPNQKDLVEIGKNYKVVANIPYYITSRFLRTIFTEWPKPNLIALTIQKEVAQRIMARPPKMNLLALSVQFFSEPKIVGYISKENFRPRPKVDSAIIKLTPREKLLTENHENFFKIAKAGFSSKRKQLINSLSTNLKKEREEIKKILKEARINQEIRPGELNIDDWIKLEKLFN